MGELDKKLQEVLESLNKTFDIEIQDQGDDEIITKLIIRRKKPNNDGAEFLEKFLGFFGPIVEQISDGEKEVVYEEGTGLTIRRINE
jgi:hypothetical protein